MMTMTTDNSGRNTDHFLPQVFRFGFIFCGRASIMVILSLDYDHPSCRTTLSCHNLPMSCQSVSVRRS